MYIELHTASAFSFLDGASLPRTLVERAAALGYPAVALLDRDGVYGAPQFFRAAKAAGLKAFLGSDVTMRPERAGADGRSAAAARSRPEGHPALTAASIRSACALSKFRQ